MSRARRKGKLIVQGELEAGGSYQVREIKRPLGGILQCLGLGAVRCNRRTFVKFEIPPDSCAHAQLSALLQSQQKCDHPRSESKPKESRFHRQFHRLLAEAGSRLIVHPVRQLSTWILPKLAPVRAYARAILGKSDKPSEPSFFFSSSDSIGKSERMNKAQKILTLIFLVLFVSTLIWFPRTDGYDHFYYWFFLAPNAGMMTAWSNVKLEWISLAVIYLGLFFLLKRRTQ